MTVTTRLLCIVVNVAYTLKWPRMSFSLFAWCVLVSATHSENTADNKLHDVFATFNLRKTPVEWVETCCDWSLWIFITQACFAKSVL